MDFLVGFLILVGILVIVHEFGHFFMAKLFGVRVEVFSVGFGKPLLTKKVGETQYRVCLIPLGGYVKLYGEEGEVEDEASFAKKHPLKKILIALGGPLFNFLFSILLLTFLLSLSREVPKYLYEKVVVGYVSEDSPLYGKVKVGDELLSINGKEVKNWKELNLALISQRLEGEVTFVFLRDGKRVKVKLKRDELKGDLGIYPYLKPIVGGVLKGSPAQQVGIREGDLILEVNGKKISSWFEIPPLIRSSDLINLKVKRKDKVLKFFLVPVRRGKVKLIGIRPKLELIKERLGPLEAFKSSLEINYKMTVLTLKFLVGILKGQVSLKNLGGPLSIAYMAGEEMKKGIYAFLNLMVFISLQLGIFNLIPLPILDGGLVLIFLMEGLRGRSLPKKFMEYWITLGYVIISLLILLVLINDLRRILKG